jgi:hypothetical protein
MSKFSKVGILLLLCTLTFSCKDFQSNDLVFSSKEWKESDFRVRGRMYSNLLDQKLLIGRTRTEVLEILGKSDEEYKDSVKYAIDLGSSFERWIQRNFLMITFDEQTQKVKEVAVIDS